MTMNAQESKQAPVVVIGYGTAGVNAVIALRNAGYDGPVSVFSDTGILQYSPILTSYYAGGEKTYDECFPWSADELDQLNVDLHANCPVTDLDPAAHTVLTADGAFAYSKCLIASGAHPVCTGFPGVQGGDYEPLVLRTMDDAERLKGVLDDPTCSRVLVSGASMVALKMLEACLKRGKHVAIVGVNPHVLDFNALPPAAERFERGLAAKGVKMRFGQKIVSVKRVDALRPDADAPARPWHLEVEFSGGDVEAFDEIAVAHGVRSNLAFVREGSLTIDRALVVDEFMRTSDSDVYAAGDVAQALELVSGEKQVVGIWKNAAVQGAVAGAAIAAELAGAQPQAKQAFAGALPANTIAVDGTLFISAGTVSAGEGRTVEVRETDDMTVVYVFQDAPEGGRRLVGFNITCDNDEPGSVAYDTGAMLTMRIERACR